MSTEAYLLAPARLSHLPEIYKLCMKSLKAGPEGSLPFAPHKIKNVIHELISSPHQLAVVALKNGKVKGLILGMVSSHAYAEGVTAEDIALYVTPCLRGTKCYSDLAEVYADWCSRIPNLLVSTMGLSQLNATTQVMDKTYRNLGYKREAVTYLKLGEGYERHS
jgi:hypothetical protein